MGLRPGEWEDLTPAEVWALWKAWRWRRSRDLEVVAVAVAWLRGMLDNKTDWRKIARSLPGYEPDEEAP